MKHKRKTEPLTDEQRWETAAALFEDPIEFTKIANASRLLTAAEERELFGPGKTRQISIRLPEREWEPTLR